MFTFLGGYPAPSLLGIGGALLVAADRAALMLWIAIALLVATLVHVRNAYGVFAVPVTGALVGAVAWWGQPRLQDAFAAALCWFLLFGSMRAVHELLRSRRRDASDADMLGSLTRVPRGMWVLLFWTHLPDQHDQMVDLATPPPTPSPSKPLPPRPPPTAIMNCRCSTRTKSRCGREAAWPGLLRQMRAGYRRAAGNSGSTSSKTEMPACAR